MMKTLLLAVTISLLLSACGSGTPGAEPASAPVQEAQTATSPASADATPPPTVAAGSAPSAAAGDPVTDLAATEAAGNAAVDAAIDSNLGDHGKYQAVVIELQAAVSADDAARVAALAHYPISVDIGGKQTTLKNEKEFIGRYAEFMTADIRKAIVETKYADLFVNYKGVMFGSGQAWINGICKDDPCKAFDVKLVTLQHGP